ncbi:DUF4124 domain-containing protein [Chitinilyticum litopenaei]|uniref:DUF4124 domain-containing protein n=1 Tax=Chitinilyticum litopenaei TaxID=1121276 RepID=UPI0004091E8C|nr:DUF4124 domain-containing protein [Chitinilyticum litopenaei]
MKRFTLILALLLAAGAQAQIYKWTDDSGRVHYSDQPPPGKGGQAKVVDTKGAAVSSVSSGGGKASASVAASKPEVMPSPVARKDPNGPGCEDARKRLSFLQGAKLYKNVSNDKGQMEFIDEKKKQEEIRTQTEFLEKNCK